MESKKKEPIECEHCVLKLSTKFSLKRHVAKFHKNAAGDHSYNDKTSRKSRLVCPSEGCEEDFLKYSELRAHLLQNHDIDVELEELSFSSMTEFEQWKDVLQQNELSMYTQDTGSKSLKNGVTRIFYNCHRSYSYQSKGKNIRAIKSTGTNKMGKACPSRLELSIGNGNEETIVSVKYWKTHCGHAEELGKITLNRDIRLQIAGKLKEGVSFDRILDSVRDSEVADDILPRTLLLDRKDIHNIVRDFNINYATKRHKNDAISVKLWVEEMSKLGEDSPILYYKGQNETGHELGADDFCLVLMTNFQAQQLTQFGKNKICIDGTHGTTGYDFTLYTLVTVDEFGAGCPVAYCFSNRSDETIFRVFFNAIKSKVGIISAEVFMSDDAPAFYNAWTSVMGSVSHKLLCTWHIDKNWRQNLNKITGNAEKKALVYKTLRVLLELTNVDDFVIYLEQVLRDLLNDADTKEFAEYFRRHYYNRPKSWAYCYRIGLGINTNMYLESLHKVLKYTYLDGKKVKRLDKSINAVMKLARDSFFKRLIKLSKHTPTDKIKNIHQSHTASLNIKLTNIKVIEEQKEWIIKSSRNPLQEYQIVKAQETCDDFCLKCKECNICIHTFKCSCVDNLIKMNICKHIHACSREFFTIPTFDSSTVNEHRHDKEIADLLEMKRINVNVDTNNNMSLLKKIELLSGLVSAVSLSDEDNLAIEKQLDKLIETVNKTKLINFDSKENVNVNKKIDKQKRLCKGKSKNAKEMVFIDNIKSASDVKNEMNTICLYSTKKKQQRKQDIKKPSVNETNAIISGLRNENSETVDIHHHQASDHIYI